MGDASTIGRAIRDKISKVVRDVMNLATLNVIAATPVDTGHAASNWIISYGAPYTAIVGSRIAVDTTVRDSALATLQEYDVGRDGVVYLRNNVPYLKFLDGGSSQQAPANFIAIALMGGARLAPHGMKGRVQKLLRRVSQGAYKRGKRP